MYPFNSKETYLQARKDWTEYYQEIAARIRKTKLALKEEERRTGSTYKWYDLNSDREDARNALAELQEMKDEAHRQWKEARKVCAG